MEKEVYRYKTEKRKCSVCLIALFSVLTRRYKTEKRKCSLFSVLTRRRRIAIFFLFLFSLSFFLLTRRRARAAISRLVKRGKKGKKERKKKKKTETAASEIAAILPRLGRRCGSRGRYRRKIEKLGEHCCLFRKAWRALLFVSRLLCVSEDLGRCGSRGRYRMARWAFHVVVAGARK
jgi:hypothetical protein